MKVLFLDIDGVLNSERFREEEPGQAVDRRAVGLLKRVIDATGAKLVLSSGWRFWFDDAMTPCEECARHLCAILAEQGLVLSGKTPDFSTAEIRAERTFSRVKAKEISAWLGAHPEAGQYAVLDDLELKDDEVNAHLIRVDGRIGLSEADAKRVVKRLNGS